MEIAHKTKNFILFLFHGCLISQFFGIRANCGNRRRNPEKGYPFTLQTTIALFFESRPLVNKNSNLCCLRFNYFPASACQLGNTRIMAVLLTCWQSVDFVFVTDKRVLSTQQKDSIQSAEAIDLKVNYAPFEL